MREEIKNELRLFYCNCIHSAMGIVGITWKKAKSRSSYPVKDTYLIRGNEVTEENLALNARRLIGYGSLACWHQI